MKNLILKLIVVILFVIVAYNVCKYTPYYIEKVHYSKDEIRFVMDGEEKTKSMPHPVKIKEGKVMLSIDTIREFIDQYAYYNEEYQTVMIAYGLNIIKMPIDNTHITVNDTIKAIDVPAKREEVSGESVVYVPIEALEDFYDIHVVYQEKVIITTSNAEYYELIPSKDIRVKAYKLEKSRTTGIAKKRRIFICFR